MNIYHQPADPVTGANQSKPADPKAPTKSWLPELTAHRNIADPLERDAQVQVLLAGRPLKVPNNWISMNLDAKAKYLDEHYPLVVKA